MRLNANINPESYEWTSLKTDKMAPQVLYLQSTEINNLLTVSITFNKYITLCNDMFN